MVKQITAKSFKKYGYVIEYPRQNSASRSANLFRVVVREPRPLGWRIAYLVVRDRRLDRLEQHPASYESFEPVKGKSILFVTRSRDERKIEAFYLDRPVVLYKGVWHGIIRVGKASEVKITENARVKCVYWNLARKLLNTI